jgi:hypothetical protein
MRAQVRLFGALTLLGEPFDNIEAGAGQSILLSGEAYSATKGLIVCHKVVQRRE